MANPVPAENPAPEEHTLDRRPAQAGLALYRKYRPATFAEVRGQEHVTAPLRQALKSGRINHAYLFSGPRGCGKTSSARILARSLNCVNGPTPDPCGVCDSCVALAPSGPGSIDVIEIDAASHGGVDDARDLRERAFYSPVAGRYKIYIIDEAHMVTSQGFNALLKLVEEPPPHLKFIFATTEPEKVIPTIRSRTHHYPFRLMPPSVMRELTEEILNSEQVPFEAAVLPLVVRAGGGSARDTLSILDQLLAGSDEGGIRYDRAVALLGYTDASLIDEIVDSFAAADGATVFRAVNKVIEGGHEPRRFATDLLDRFRDLIVLASVPDAITSGLLEVPPDRVEVMTAQASRSGLAQLTRAADIISAGLDQMRGATSPRLLLELMCAQVLLPGAGTDERSVLARLERLEAGYRAPQPAAPQPQTPQSPAERPAPPRPSPRSSGEVASASAPAREAQAREAQPSPAAQPAPPSARDIQPVPEPAPAASYAPPASHPATAPPAPRGTATTEVLQQGWPALLEALKSRSKVAYFLLSNTSVVSLDEGGLTLRFPKPGDVKGFQSSKHEGLLKEVLHARYGITVMIRAVAGGTPAAGERRPGGGPGAAGPAQPQAAYHQPAPPTAAAPFSPAAGQPAGPSAGPSGPPEWAVAPRIAAPGNVATPGNSAPSAPGPVAVAQSPGSMAASGQAAVSLVRGHSAVGAASTGTVGAFSREEDAPFPGDDPYAHDDELAGSVNADTELTGISLIERDLGASIIAEYED
jgi:DNA polymerase III subunit gamma/tau